MAAPKYTQEQLDKAIELAIEGETISHIVDAICTTPYQFWQYRQEYPYFKKKFADAHQEGLDHLADKVLKVADDVEDVQRGRLKSDNLKWYLSKRKPQVYGEKIDLNINQTLDISGVLSAARERLVGHTDSERITESTASMQPKQIASKEHKE